MASPLHVKSYGRMMEVCTIVALASYVTLSLWNGNVVIIQRRQNVAMCLLPRKRSNSLTFEANVSKLMHGWITTAIPTTFRSSTAWRLYLQFLGEPISLRQFMLGWNDIISSWTGYYLCNLGTHLDMQSPLPEAAQAALLQTGDGKTTAHVPMVQICDRFFDWIMLHQTKASDRRGSRLCWT